jgi:hypothetical protein
VVDQLACIGLAEASLDPFDMPVLDVKVRGDGFVEQITPVAIQGLRQGVKRASLSPLASVAESVAEFG